MSLKQEINQRRTFGIISHPDAGKTTLTEKLLLFGGAIHQAGTVKARKSKRYATSDFMEIEKQRGISVSSSVMGFDYQGYKINLLDTPGHQDFSEDTYRTLTAVDSALMVIDAVKGVETQTRKLMEVCRMRQTPIMTFINKCDREGQDPIALLDEIEKELNIQVCPLSWPIGLGQSFQGVYNLFQKEVLLFKAHQKQDNSVRVEDLNDPVLVDMIGEDAAAQLIDDVELLTGVYPSFSVDDYLAGRITPVFFGSALNNFGVKELLDCFVKHAPGPLARETDVDVVSPSDSAFSGFIFKIHANMDLKHRDRLAFLRICSGSFKRHQRYFHVRSKKQLRFSSPTAFMAQEKNIIDEAFPGDIVGLHDTGQLQIGDTLTSGKSFQYKGIPSFSPELFKVVVNMDPLKQKQLKKGLKHLCEEGVAQLFIRHLDQQLIVGTVGALQYDVILYRLEHEYGAQCRFDALPYIKAVWFSAEQVVLDSFVQSRQRQIAKDVSDQWLYLAETKWSLEREIKENENIQFRFTSEA